jgi:hypothetical protein
MVWKVTNVLRPHQKEFFGWLKGEIEKKMQELIKLGI